MLFQHYTQAPWEPRLWPNFTPQEHHGAKNESPNHPLFRHSEKYGHRSERLLGLTQESNQKGETQ